MAIMSANPIVGLYGNPFGGTDSENASNLTALQNSGFNTLVFWSLHVMPSGTLVLNGKPLTVNNGVVSWQLQELAPLIQGLRSGGFNRILFSIGSGSSDFDHIQSLMGSQEGMTTLLTNFDALMDALPIDGFDYDLEYNVSGTGCDQYNAMTNTVVQLSLLFQSYGSGIVTFCPFNCENFWLNCMEQIVQQNTQWVNDQVVQWWNLQTYGPAVSPSQWAQTMTQFGLSNLGIKDASSFIAPGYSVDYEQTPSQLQSDVQGQGVTGGAWLWNTGSLFASSYSPTDWAQAIITGLSNQGSSAGK